MAFQAQKWEREIAPCTQSDVFRAAITVLENAEKYKIEEMDANAYSIRLKTGISWKSWGENVQITIGCLADSLSEIIITSTLKWGLLDWGKNQENLKEIFILIYGELSKLICTELYDDDKKV